MNKLLELNNGVVKPSLGFGTANMGNKNAKLNAFEIALDVGYRHFDSASMYNNEIELGNTLSKLKNNYLREDLFIASKLWNSDHGYEATKQAFELSLKNLQLDYLDLYLIHWPVTGLRLDSYRAMEELYDEGLIKAIGISNYTTIHLTELLDNCSVLPTINQVEFNPLLFQKELMDFCQNNNIILEAYSPILAVVRKRSDHPVISKIAEKHGKSLAQVCIRWSLQLGNSVVPRSSNKERIVENFTVFDFELDHNDMIELGSINEHLRLEWDPTGEP